MAENLGPLVSYNAAADLSAKQYFLVKITAAQTVNLCGDGEMAVGVLQNKPTSGEAATVSRDGDVTWASAGAAVAVNAKIASDANGQAITATTGDEVIGIARTAAGAQNELFEMVQTRADARAA